MVIYQVISCRSRGFLLAFSLLASGTISLHAEPLDELVSGGAKGLSAQRAAIIAKDPKAIESLAKLMKEAEKAIRKGPLSVTDKTQTPPSGDKQDYLSIGPYWWPDPKGKAGDPYIRRDGRINPETRGEHVDYDRKGRLFSHTRTFSRAAYLSGNPKYGIAAVELLEVWFVNPKTRMNPNLNFAQGIPGKVDGRAAGIIEWVGADSVLSAIQLLRVDGHLSEKTDQALQKWFRDYADWLQTSEIGKDERDAGNNHGTWYDFHLVGILIFLEREAEAKAILEKVKKRIATQIEPDGRQPHELARTKSLSYSKMNLRAFIKLAEFGERLEVDLWGYETKDGRSIRGAEAFLKPYLDGMKKWPYEQIH